VLLVVIDLNEHLKSMNQHGIDYFVREHLKELLGFAQNSENESVLNSIIKNKQVLVALNKIDLISANEEIELFESLLKIYKEKGIILTRISCIDDSRANISELLNQMKIKLATLYTRKILLFRLVTNYFTIIFKLKILDAQQTCPRRLCSLNKDIVLI
jgi:50S ribosomal subunit-associated GTPase HflX